MVLDPLGVCFRGDGEEQVFTQVLDVEAVGGFEGPPHPGLPQGLQVLLLALDQQHVFVYPAQEEGLCDGVRHHLVPEEAGVQRLEVREDLVAGVSRGGLGARGDPRGPLGQPREHDGQGVRSELQERLHP